MNERRRMIAYFLHSLLLALYEVQRFKWPLRYFRIYTKISWERWKKLLWPVWKTVPAPKYINNQQIHFIIYHALYSKCSRQHVSADIPTIFRVILLQEYKMYKCVCVTFTTWQLTVNHICTFYTLIIIIIIIIRRRRISPWRWPE